MGKTNNLTTGNIFGTLISFALPVLLALFLQAMYGAVDLLVVGRFAETADVSGVATGSMLMQTVTNVITGLAMGITILVGRRIGENQPRKAGMAVGGGICMFSVFAVILTAALVFGSGTIASVMHAPKEAFEQTSAYIKVCGAGAVFIVAYNVLGSVFRGIGDSKTPLIAVSIACILNVFGDLLLVKVFGMGAEGAALATVISQAASVVISLCIIARKKLPFDFSKRSIRFNREVISMELKLGIPVALQELLVGVSFLVIQTIVNTIGVTESAGVGVAEKVCIFLMLVPSAYMQSMSAFVAQNMGAGEEVRAKKALGYGIATAVSVGVIMSYLAFSHGEFLSMLFTKDTGVAAASHSYLKAYAIDCLLTPFLFCFMGYFNGCGKTLFVMLQGIFGAFFIRVPIVYLMSLTEGATLFRIGLGTPASSMVQILLCLIMFRYYQKKQVKINNIG